MKNNNFLIEIKLLLSPKVPFKRFVLATCLLTTLTPGVSQGAIAVDDTMLEQLETVVNEAMITYHVPGVAIAIVEGDEIVYSNGFGLRNIETQEPVTTDTRFIIYSMTKAMNSTMMATLVDDGLLEWKQPVVEIWPDLTLPTRKLTRKVQVRDLMQQSTGLNEDYNMVFYDSKFNGISPEEQLNSLAELPVVAKLKQMFIFNDHTYAASGHIGALAAGATFGSNVSEVYNQLMQERVFNPIGMESVILSTDLPAIGGDYATGHAFNIVTNAFEPLLHPNFRGYEPAAGVSTNVEDVGRFLITHLNNGVTPDGRRIVSGKNLKKTRKPHHKVDEWLFNIIYPRAQARYTNMGWATAKQPNGVKMFGYSGGYEGFTSDMTIIPDADVGIVILTNLDIFYGASNSIYFFSVVRESLFELLYGLEPTIAEITAEKFQQEWEEIVIPRDSIQVTFSANTVAPYLGNYEKGWQLELRSDETLWLVWQGEYEYQLIFLPDGTYRIGNGSYLGRIISFSSEEGITTRRKGITTMTITVGDIETVSKID